eukprot:gnl/MRDRNA2_/MRDRNA2_119063_c0_seq1.p1 gnl/MRDRNA2_/MRDRNA2_119063_c0~~gnl/MRDRNA2_/MRDRNA2_119063_c0_seq1.p1  ORF type:complete len:259 (+),score=48.16 gnl/MRDRNA2_/MRDRNA2_119063_c0_seq1:51-779(+)
MNSAPPQPQACIRRVGRLLARLCLWEAESGQTASKPAAFPEPRVAHGPEPPPDLGSSDDAKTWEAAKYLERADKEREAGSIAFRCGRIDEAIERYRDGAVAALDMSARAADLIRTGSERASFIGEVNTNRIRVLSNLALCYQKKNNLEQAKHYCNLCLGVDPKSVRALTVLGATHYLQGDVQGAVDIILKALNIDPWDKGARGEKARIILKESQKENAGYTAKDVAKAQIRVQMDNDPLDVI